MVIDSPPSYFPRIFVQQEAYSVAGETEFGWWSIDHYLSYHIDCPDGCGLKNLLGVERIRHTFR